MDEYKRNSTWYWRGKTLDWLFTDTEEGFQDELKENPTDKSLLWYKDNPIKYQLNSDGFRLPYDLTKEKGNVFLGCSFTFGIGVHYEKTWAHLLHEKIGGGKYWNLGCSGAGFQTTFRMLYNYYNKIKINNIFLHLPFNYRYEVFIEKGTKVFDRSQDYQNELTHGRWATISPQQEEYMKPLGFLNEEWSKVYANDLNNHNYVQTNLLAIYGLAQELNVPLYYVGEFPIVSDKDNDDIPSRARDEHPSPQYHQRLAEHFYQLYNNQNTFRSKRLI